jgi:ribosomal-protein-serine acetyltransferase
MTATRASATAFPLEVRPGLVLELMNPSMAEEFLEVVQRNLPRLARWEPWAGVPQTRSGISIFLAWQAQGHVSGTTVPLVVRHDGAMAGTCSARIDATEGTAEIGYWIDEAAEGTGVAHASVDALVRHLLERGDLGRLQARTAVGNRRSRALLERLGFDFEGVLRASQRINGGRADMAMYGMVPPLRG